MRRLKQASIPPDSNADSQKKLDIVRNRKKNSSDAKLHNSTDNLFQALEERPLTDAERAIIDARVAMQRKMYALFEKRETARKAEALIELCPELRPCEAEMALEFCKGSEAAAAERLTGDWTFVRRVRQACGTTAPAPSPSRRRREEQREREEPERRCATTTTATSRPPTPRAPRRSSSRRWATASSSAPSGAGPRPWGRTTWRRRRATGEQATRRTTKEEESRPRALLRPSPLERWRGRGPRRLEPAPRDRALSLSLLRMRGRGSSRRR